MACLSKYNAIYRGKYVSEGWLIKDELGQTLTQFRISKNGQVVGGWLAEGEKVSVKDLEVALDDYKRLME